MADQSIVISPVLPASPMHLFDISFSDIDLIYFFSRYWFDIGDLQKCHAIQFLKIQSSLASIQECTKSLSFKICKVFLQQWQWSSWLGTLIPMSDSRNVVLWSKLELWSSLEHLLFQLPVLAINPFLHWRGWYCSEWNSLSEWHFQYEAGQYICCYNSHNILTYMSILGAIWTQHGDHFGTALETHGDHLGRGGCTKTSQNPGIAKIGLTPPRPPILALWWIWRNKTLKCESQHFVNKSA